MINPTWLAGPPPTITSMSQYTVGLDARCNSFGSWASATWPATRRTIYVPLWLPWGITVTHLFWVNGAAVSGNVDIGIYSAAAGLPVTKLLSSGSTAGSGTNAFQSVNVTDTYFGPGNYFMALMIDNTTATTLRVAGSTGTMALKQLGMAQETPGSFPLPATATPIAVTSSYIPLFGLATVSTI